MLGWRTILVKCRWQRSSIFSVAILLWLTAYGSAAYGLELTMAKHLFDIKGTFNQPSDVAVAKNGTIYVVDGVNGRIQAFSPSGSYLFTIGRPGTGPGEFAFPLGMDIDESGRIYVADSRNHRIQIFTAKGDFISEIPVPDDNGNKADPTDVAVNDSGKWFFVADNNNHRILKFDIGSKKACQQLWKTRG